MDFGASTQARAQRRVEKQHTRLIQHGTTFSQDLPSNQIFVFFPTFILIMK